MQQAIQNLIRITKNDWAKIEVWRENESLRYSANRKTASRAITRWNEGQSAGNAGQSV